MVYKRLHQNLSSLSNRSIKCPNKYLTSDSSQDCNFFTEDGKPKKPFPDSWNGENGLYSVGFTARGLLGAGADAVKTASDIAAKWKKISFP